MIAYPSIAEVSPSGKGISDFGAEERALWERDRATMAHAATRQSSRQKAVD
jgi:hypothetical protein